MITHIITTVIHQFIIIMITTTTTIFIIMIPGCATLLLLLLIFTPMVSTSAGSIPKSLCILPVLYLLAFFAGARYLSLVIKSPSLTSPQLLHIHRVHHELPVLLLLFNREDCKHFSKSKVIAHNHQ